MGSARLRFDGWIAGVGTASGVRIVLGHWTASPFGLFSDVMVERPDGVRLLLAPTARIGEFVAAIYRFDEVWVVPVAVAVEADGADAAWGVAAGPLGLGFTVDRRGLLGRLLRAVPGPLAAHPVWATLVDIPARLLLGVRTRGSAGGGHREWYGVRDLLPLTAAAAAWDGQSLGHLAPVDPPVRFGFASTPRRPALVRVTTTVGVGAL